MTPAKDNVKTVAADRSVRDGRMAKAVQFLDAAIELEELHEGEGVNAMADAIVSLYVNAGIAAADAICAAKLGRHAKGESHTDAIALLKPVDKDAANSLSTLLGMKTRASYGHDPVNAKQLKQAKRAAETLVSAARL